MSDISLVDVKAYLRVTGSTDDTLLGQLLDAAEAEVCRFCGRLELPTLPPDLPTSDGAEDSVSSYDPVAPDVKAAVFMLVQAMYEATTPDDVAKIRSAVETKCMAYRTGLGI